MLIREGFDIIEEAIKLALIRQFSDDEETISRINEAFRVGEKTGIGHLVAAFGAEEAGSFLTALDRTPETVLKAEHAYGWQYGA